MTWAYRRGKKLERKVILLKKQERRDYEIMRQAMLHRTKTEWEIQRLERKLQDVIHQQDEDLYNLLLNATEEDQVEWLQHVYGDEEKE